MALLTEYPRVSPSELLMYSPSLYPRLDIQSRGRGRVILLLWFESSFLRIKTFEIELNPQLTDFLQTYRNTLPSDDPNFSPEKKDGDLADNYVMAKKNTSFYKWGEKTNYYQNSV